MDTKKHRNLYNGDWGTIFWSPKLWQPDGGPYSVRAIHAFVDLLADSGIDTFLCSPNTQVVWYPSKTLPTALDGYTRGDKRWSVWFGRPADTNLNMTNRYLDLLEAGVDWMEETASYCRTRGVSPWVSVRMNDMHGAADPAGNPLNCPLFADPQYRLSGEAINPSDPPKPYWQALNYEKPQVREYMLSVIRELVMDYDFEGLELDWLRNPAICEPNASEEVIEMMTDWVAEIRDLTERKAAQTGRPYPLGLRIPGQLAMLRSIGLDVKTMVQRGLVDFVNPSNFMQTSWDMPHDELRRELGDEIAMYGVIELILNGVYGYSPDTGAREARYPFASAPALRGNAAGKLVLGADGIEHYNFYAADEDDASRICTWDNIRADYSAIAGIDDLDQLRGQSKHYLMGTLFAPCWYPPFELPEPLPQVLGPLWRRDFRLPMCAEPADSGLELIIQVVVEKTDQAPSIGVSFNGSWPTFACEKTDALLFPNRPVTHHLPENQAFNFVFDVATIKDGWNNITVYNGSQDADRAERKRPRTYDQDKIGQGNDQAPGDGSFRVQSIELAVK